ncbi:MAG: hypothetical protein LBT83_07880, partial [Tannerella sp.]|jgi:uncharacterized protein YbdZ (MbtH family)|nr:hypothetical protein [Tannerella sp.]
VFIIAFLNSQFSILHSFQALPFIPSSPKALPLGWDMTGFQPYGVCAVTVFIIALHHSPFSLLHSFQALPFIPSSPKALPLGWDITGFQPYGDDIDS